MSTLPFRKVSFKKPIERLDCSVPLPKVWQSSLRNTEGLQVEAALIRIAGTWDANRFDKKLQTVVEQFPLLKAVLSPSQQSIAISESNRVRWRLLDRPEILQQVLNKGWTADIQPLLQLSLENNILWEALVAVDEEEGYLVCLTALPVIADAKMLHAALGQLESQFRGQAASATQREIIARDRLANFHKSAWASHRAPLLDQESKLSPSLPLRTGLSTHAGSCSFRLPSQTWQKLVDHARTLGLPSFTVAAVLMQAALQKLLNQNIGPVLIKSSLRFPKAPLPANASGWESLQVPCSVEHNFTQWLEAGEQSGWSPMPHPETYPWPQGLWVGVGLLPSSTEAQQLRILSSDPGPTNLLWLCPDGDGETYLTWRKQSWEGEFPLSLAAVLKELSELWSENPDQALKTLPINNVVLPLWQRWNSSYQAFHLEQTLPQLLGPAMAKAGDTIAIRSRNGELSYRQLDMQSKQVALWLKNKGIGVGDLVGIALPRTPAMMVTLLGVLRAGAGYVPLDPNFPADRLQYMLKDSKVKGCFCEDVMQAAIIPSCPAWIWNEVSHQLPEYMADQWQDPAQDPSSIAYVIYTSGSTGLPKGVMLGHRSVVNFLLSMQQKPGMDSSDRVLAITTLSFDIAVLELLLPLLTGASLYLVNAEEGKDGKLLRHIIEEESITIFQATPSNYRLLLDAGWVGSKIRKALCGGEAFPIDVARRLLPIVPEVWNMYGPTETTVWSTVHLIQKVDGLIPIGRPIANTAIYILDEKLNPVLPGEKGEIYIGGSGLALGYFGQTELTLDRFQMIPGLAVLAYKTGDIGRYLWDGVVEIFGRSDHQVKLRGYRMELGEIEAVIANLPGVEQCMAAVKDFGEDDPRLVAYVTINVQYLERNIRQAAKEKLPVYMLPAHYVVLQKMPLLPNGKTDRKQLPHPLEVASVPVETPKFENVASIGNDTNTPQIPDSSTLLPMTPSQSRMIFTEELDPDTTVHNLIGAWVINGAMDFQAFRRAMESLIIEQDSLRMAAVPSEQGYALQLSPPFAPELRIHGREKTNMTLDDVRLAILEIAREKLDVTQVPNFRMGLFRLSTDATVFFLITHHMFWDGFSYGVMWKNIQRLYKEVLVTGRAKTKIPPFNFSHYALQRSTELQAPHIQEEMNYWLKVYKDLPEPLELAYDYTRPAVLKHSASTAWIPWDSQLDTKLQHVAKTIGCTVYHVILSAYYVLLYRMSGQGDLVIGTPVHGRQQVEVFELLGNFINVVALRQNLQTDMSFLQLVDRVKTSTTEAMAHCDLPFEKLVAALKLHRDAGRTPLYNTMFFYQDLSLQKIQFGSALVEGLRLPNSTVDTDLILWVERYAHNTFAGFNFRVDLWEQGTIDSIAQSFRHLLDLLLSDPEQSLKKPSLVPTAQQELLIKTWNQSDRDEPKLQTLPAIFDEQLQKAPQRIAVQDLKGNQITWQQLDLRARQLAQILRQKGAKPGAVIGLCHSRQIDLVISLLAILRTGAAYLPLDPMFPIDRLNYMVEDAGACLILTESAYQNILQTSKVPRLNLDQMQDQWKAVDASQDQGPLPQAEDLAYLIYTSGSTGKPKGVEIQHKAVAEFLQAFRAAVDIPETPRTLAITTISFDISVLEIFGTLAWGGTVVLVDQEKTVDGPALIKVLTDYNINLMQATPSTWRLLMDSRWFGHNELTALCGGEALPRDLARELLPRTRALWNVYGPTEATVWATVARITDAEAPITIGRVLPRYEAYILDEDNQLLPVGSIGLLYLGGPALAKAYHNRPDLTIDRFVPHPFKARERVYNTGDLCRYRADGRLEYLSRQDNQIKLRGYRIELGEIEACIAALAEIKQAIVIVREDQPGDQRLVAYAILSGPQVLSLNQLNQSLRQILPQYMLPNHLVLLKEFPLTGSGKVDKKALPMPQAEEEPARDIHSKKATIETLSPAEQKLANIWIEMIGIKKVRRADNFFDLGGHSLLALKVLHRCQLELGANFKVRDLLLMNLAQLANQLPDEAPAAGRMKGERQ